MASPENCFTVILINFNFLETTIRFVGCSIVYVQLLQDFAILSLKCVSIATLTFLGHRARC